jgi:hypothetical protein
MSLVSDKLMKELVTKRNAMVTSVAELLDIGHQHYPRSSTSGPSCRWSLR